VSAPRSARGGTARTDAPAAVAPSSPADAPVEAAPPDAPRAGVPEGAAEEALRFTTPAFTPAGLAYDAVSDRYIVGDRDARKLTVVDEASQRVANLAGAQSAGFGEIGAFEIDPHEGDLWVVSSDPNRRSSTLHKLQLISGRVLYALPLDESFGAARFGDVAVTPRSTVLALDVEGRRVFRALPKARALELAATLDVPEPLSIAPQSDTVAYVSHGSGILRLDLAARTARPVAASKDVDVTGLARLRWHGGSLVGVQRLADGTCRIVRLQLDPNGQRVRSAEVLDADLRMADPTAAALSGDGFYYLAGTGTFGGIAVDSVVRRVGIK
jgi:hypothetical protein